MLFKLWYIKFGHIVQRGLSIGSIERKNIGILEAGGYFIKTRRAHSGIIKKDVNLRN